MAYEPLSSAKIHGRCVRSGCHPVYPYPGGIWHFSDGCGSIQDIWNCTRLHRHVAGYCPDILSFAANLLGSIVLVLPTLVFATASVIHRGFRNTEKRAIGLYVGVFLLTLLIRAVYALLDPHDAFLALLACRDFMIGNSTKKIFD